MNPEIEKLIELALADGEITQKERSVILKKAEKLGEDPDEINMILDGKQHQLKTNKQKEKVGNIKICPACGDSVKSMVLNCKSCGHEFNRSVQSDSLKEMIKKLEKIDVNDLGVDYEENVAKIVKSFAVPSNFEEIYQFGIYCVNAIDSSANSWRVDSSAYESKAMECISLLRVSNNNNSQDKDVLISEIQDILAEKKRRISRNERKDWIIIIIVLAVMGLIAYWVWG
jgi:hypothetical protein